MTRETLLQLADRCEAATGADRELDAEIWLACVLGATRKERRYHHKASDSECVIDETREHGRLIVVPTYSESIDAAATLVPEGWDWEVGRYASNLHQATVWERGYYDDADPIFAATPALSLTSAALRARAEGME